MYKSRVKVPESLLTLLWHRPCLRGGEQRWGAISEMAWANTHKFAKADSVTAPSCPEFSGNGCFYWSAKRGWFIAHTSGKCFSNKFILDQTLLGQCDAPQGASKHTPGLMPVRDTVQCGALQVHIKPTDYQKEHCNLLNQVICLLSASYLMTSLVYLSSPVWQAAQKAIIKWLILLSCFFQMLSSLPITQMHLSEVPRPFSAPEFQLSVKQ